MAMPEDLAWRAWTLLGALAAATERVRLGALVTGITYRHPSILATQAVTVDHISGGRLELGVGAAWFAREHRELGIRFPPAAERIRRLDEAVAVMRLLMTQDRASFHDRPLPPRERHLQPQARAAPPPAGLDRPRWREADASRRRSPRRRVARVRLSRRAGRKARLVDELARRAGRDPASIAKSTALSLSEPWDEVRSVAESLRDAGFSYLTVSWPSEGRGRLEEFVTEVMPQLRAM
jgi:alkanesulfonate monooxygenase SsuD/methylene tetrahydromethanopterin reductase-like flavin-dependent oxidoreductase (luciferase family)